MSELRELYQSVILDHNKKPRNFGSLGAPSHQADGHNPLCGDKLTVQLRLEDDVVSELKFEGQGCAISTASASLMTEAVKGKTLEQVEDIFGAFHALVTSDPNQEPETERLGKLSVFGGVREYPMRVKCATLSWHTLRAALAGTAEVTTE